MLNLSSNNIEDITELNALWKVEDLNLSCNKINKVTGLENMMRSLKKLNLSHNRLASLNYFRENVHNGMIAPNLTTVDFNDNYIGDLQQIQALKPITSLKEVTFQSKNSSNPVCDFVNYKQVVLGFLPQIVQLDGQSIYELGIDFSKNQNNNNNLIESAGSHSIATPLAGHHGINNYDPSSVLRHIQSSEQQRRQMMLNGPR